MNRLAGIWVLAAHQLRIRVRTIAIWGVALGGLGALYVALFPSMGGIMESYLQEAPESMQGFLGGPDGSLTIEQWLELEFFNGIIPIALPFFLMIIGARAIAGSEERKTLDLLMSNPVPRWHLVAGTMATMALGLAGVLAITWILTYVAVPAAGVDLAPGRLAQGIITLWAFCLFFGALALLISSLVRRAALAIAVPGVILVGMYVTDTLGQLSRTMEPLRVVALQYHLGSPLGGDFPWAAFLLLLAGSIVLAAASAAAFSRRDIYT